MNLNIAAKSSITVSQLFFPENKIRLPLVPLAKTEPWVIKDELLEKKIFVPASIINLLFSGKTNVLFIIHNAPPSPDVICLIA